jgi:hypothetical protein
MLQESRVNKHFVLIVIVLLFVVTACGSPSGEDDAAQPAKVSEQDEAQAPDEQPLSDVDPETPGEQVSESPAVEPVEQASADDVADTSGSEEGPAELEAETEAIMPTKLEDIQAMQVTLAVENLDSGDVMKASYSFVRPDRYMTNLVGLETMAFDDTTYRRIQEQWVEQPILPAGVTMLAVEEVAGAFTDRATIYELLEEPGGSGLSYVGEESLNGIDMLVYSYDGGITSPITGIINGEVRVWIGKTDGLIYQQIVENSSDTGLGPRSRGIVEIVYGAAVTIEGLE